MSQIPQDTSLYLLCAVFAYFGGSLKASFKAGVLIRKSVFYSWHATRRCAATPYKSHYYCYTSVRIDVSRQTDCFGSYVDKTCFTNRINLAQHHCGPCSISMPARSLLAGSGCSKGNLIPSGRGESNLIPALHQHALQILVQRGKVTPRLVMLYLITKAVTCGRPISSKSLLRSVCLGLRSETFIAKLSQYSDTRYVVFLFSRMGVARV